MPPPERFDHQPAMLSLKAEAPRDSRTESTESSVEEATLPRDLPSSTDRRDPKSMIRKGYDEYRRSCKELAALATEMRKHLVENGSLSESGSGLILEVEEQLEKLYDCDWGKGECLKRVALLFESQTVDADWDEKLVKFVFEYSGFLATRYLVDGSVIEEGQKIIKELGLDPFRGTLTPPDGRGT